MKKCLRCEQAYGDDTNFCLSDGSTLVSVSDSFASQDETPTVYSGAPPTNYGSGSPPTNYGSSSSAPQFTPPASPVAPPVRKKSNPLLVALVVGFFALLAGGAVVGIVMYGAMNSADNSNTAKVSNSDDKSNKNAASEKKADNDTSAQNLKEQQAKLERDKQKLDEERRRLEEKKKEAPPTPTPQTNARTAVIIDPPSNIRTAPNGSVQCVARTRGTVVNILGSTGVADNNGTWYYTDYCGAQGVIHSTQFRF